MLVGAGLRRHGEDVAGAPGERDDPGILAPGRIGEPLDWMTEPSF